jgi:hypothetical protein
MSAALATLVFILMSLLILCQSTLQFIIIFFFSFVAFCCFLLLLFFYTKNKFSLAGMQIHAINCGITSPEILKFLKIFLMKMVFHVSLIHIFL